LTSPHFGELHLGPQRVALLRPVTSLKCFELWPWALRFDEVSVQQLRSEYLLHLGNIEPMWPPEQVWHLPRSMALSCCACHVDFTCRRWFPEHCKACGHSFCRSSTCLVSANLESLGYIGKVNVCNRCFERKHVTEARVRRHPSLSSSAVGPRVRPIGPRIACSWCFACGSIDGILKLVMEIRTRHVQPLDSPL